MTHTYLEEAGPEVRYQAAPHTFQPREQRSQDLSFLRERMAMASRPHDPEPLVRNIPKHRGCLVSDFQDFH